MDIGIDLMERTDVLGYIEVGKGAKQAHRQRPPYLPAAQRHCALEFLHPIQDLPGTPNKLLPSFRESNLAGGAPK